MPRLVSITLWNDLLTLGTSYLIYADHMVSTSWTTLCFGKPPPDRSFQSNCSHCILERGVASLPFCPAFFPVHLICDPSHVQAARAVVKNNLSLIIFPEGTRSKNGRLLPFKKVINFSLVGTGYFPHDIAHIVECMVALSMAQSCRHLLGAMQASVHSIEID